MDVLLKGPLVLQDKNKMVDHIAATDPNMSEEHGAHASERSSREATSPPSSPPTTQKELPSGRDQEDELLIQSTEAEMSEVRQENERLKTLLGRIMKDYQSLQMQFLDVVKQQEPNSKIESGPPQETIKEEADLVSLSLGTAGRGGGGGGGGQRKEEKASTTGSMNETDDGDTKMGGGLTLGLDCKFEGSSSASTQPTTNLSLENSFEDPKEEEGGDQEWPPPSKVLKTTARTTVEDEVSQQIQIKKARVSVRTRCDAPTMNDGCQWRKYGQKISKGNPCPRAYYRCTVAPGCPVRKQVQRCADDMSILISTYEGTHNHPLPMAATAMASTTSAAASMLLSGSSSSSSSRSNILPSPFLNSTPSSTLHGLSFGIPDSSRAKPYFLPSTVPSLAATPMHPTITLDLTTPSSSSATTAISSTQFNRSFTSPFASSIPRYPSTLTFSASTDAISTQSPWNRFYGSNKNHVGSSSSPYSSLNNSNSGAVAAQPTQQALSDTLAKVITSDPSFKSALASAITTIVGGGAAAAAGGQGGAATQSVGLGGQLLGLSPFGGGGGGGATTSAPTLATRLVQNPSSSFFLQPSLGLSNSMSSSGKVEKRDHIT